MEDSRMKEKINDYKCLIKAMNGGAVPCCHKVCLTLEEASAYSGIGVNKLRQLCDERPELNIWNGSKRLIKRVKLEKILESEYSI